MGARSRGPAPRPGGRGVAPPREAPGAGGDELYEAVRYFLRTYQSRDRERPCYADISISECHALEKVVASGECSVNNVAEALRLDKSTASRISASLVAKGYLERSGRSDDRRAVRMTPTAAGRSLERRIKREIVARQKRAIASLPAAILRKLPGALRALADSAARPSPADDDTPPRRPRRR